MPQQVELVSRVRGRRWHITGALLGALVLVATARAQDEVAIEQLDFTFEKPRTVVIYPTEGAAKDASPTEAGRIYWYLPYKLTNTGAASAKFFVTLSATSDKGKKYSDLPLAHVEEKVERIEGRKLHSKADVQASGAALDTYESFEPGESRSCVAVFNPIDAEADTIVIEIRGLVNDVEIKELGASTIRVTERVLKVTFKRPGDEFYTSLDQFVLESKKWEKVDRELKIPDGE
ncbi:MAG: hypothetical protein AB7O52_14080 [Planctomycetota bacterium]